MLNVCFGTKYEAILMKKPSATPTYRTRPWLPWVVSGSWATAPRPGYRQCPVHGAAGMRGKGGGNVTYTVPDSHKVT